MICSGLFAVRQSTIGQQENCDESFVQRKQRFALLRISQLNNGAATTHQLLLESVLYNGKPAFTYAFHPIAVHESVPV
jgi:hypothetical protein